MASIRHDLCTPRRVYIHVPYGDPVTERLKAAGAHYDREQHDQGQKGLYWIGKMKKDDVEQLLVDADQRKEAGQEPHQQAENLDKARVYAQVSYQGRRYYVIAEQKNPAGQPLRCRLTNLDKLAPFWVDCADCELVRTYPGRQVWDGHRYSGRTRTEYQTIGGLRRFRDRQTDARKDGEPVCGGCGKAGGELVVDLEDGIAKHHGCCDIAP